MPTTRPRHTVTETDDVARALDAASRQWPELRDDRAALLRRLIARGHESLNACGAEELTRRRAALAALSGSMTGDFPEDYRESLRREWPE
ncbi:hypothetical protein [Microbacterium thalassium]|uniref:Uncharacterized protein n=1 Tax=Microbacterium thalassium TaxID=362649 RepID=A0A7X0KVZ3_9MICO|nr:hypothetical protein [Microbacterium thalassium]MBB6392745.1 hypothetical protein [Microbacterium thalassium]